MTPPSSEKILLLFREQVFSPLWGLVLPHRQTLRWIAIPAVRHFADLGCVTTKVVVQLGRHSAWFPLEPPNR